MPICDFETTVTCPYEPSHQILPSRLQIHLVKCRKQHPMSGLKICRFNTTHHYPRADMDLHESNCPDRKSLLRLTLAEESLKPAAATFKSDRPKRPGEEDWEAEADVVKSYNPMEQCMGRKILLQPRGLSKAMRRQFGENEKMRHELLEETEKEPQAKLEKETKVVVVAKPRVPRNVKHEFHPLPGKNEEDKEGHRNPARETGSPVLALGRGRGRGRGLAFHPLPGKIEEDKEGHRNPASPARETGSPVLALGRGRGRGLALRQNL